MHKLQEIRKSRIERVSDTPIPLSETRKPRFEAKLRNNALKRNSEAALGIETRKQRSEANLGSETRKRRSEAKLGSGFCRFRVLPKRRSPVYLQNLLFFLILSFFSF